MKKAESDLFASRVCVQDTGQVPVSVVGSDHVSFDGIKGDGRQ